MKIMKSFDKVKNYPANAVFILTGSIILGIALSFLFKNPFVIFPFAIAGGYVYYKMAMDYKCPHCEAYLWYVKNKKNMKNCPKCGGSLQ